MTFKVGDVIVYPVYGVGKIKKLSTEMINGKPEDYFEVEFAYSQIAVSAAVNKAQEMGVREPLPKDELIKILQSCGKKINFSIEDVEVIEEYCKERMKTGKLEDAIDVYNSLISLEVQKVAENKNFSYTHSQRLEMIENYIKSEIEFVLGPDEVKKYLKARR